MTELILYAYGTNRQAVYFHLEAELFSRKTIYGTRKIVALDKNGNECKSAQLSSGGTEIFPEGGTGFVKLNSDGTIFENKESDSREAYEKSLHAFNLGEHSYCLTRVETDSQLSTFFEQEIEKLYVLRGINSSQLLQFAGADLFEFNLNSFRKAYVFSCKATLFLEIAKDKSESEKHTDFIKRENFDFMPDSELSLDDIDFGMM